MKTIKYILLLLGFSILSVSLRYNYVQYTKSMEKPHTHKYQIVISDDVYCLINSQKICLKELQKAVFANPDGILGPETIRCILTQNAAQKVLGKTNE